MEKGEQQSALADFSTCITLTPELPAPYFNRGVVYLELGQQENAAADVRHFLEISEDQASRHQAQALLESFGQEP